MGESRSAGLLAGTAAVVLSVGCGKWAAHLGAPPVYSIDVLLAGALVLTVLSGLGDRRRGPGARRGWPGLALSAFAGFALLRFAAGTDHSFTSVRDFAPYGYAFVAFLSARSFATAPPASRARTGRILRWALLAHLAWVALVTAVPSVPDRLPMVDARQDLHVLSLRGSTDATVVGITASLFLMAFFRTGRARDLVVSATAAALTVSLGTRAALLATAVGLAVTLGIVYFGQLDTAAVRRRALATGVLPLALLGALAVLPRTASGSKLFAWLGVIRPRNELDRVGIGTARGRSTAWHRVVDYVGSTGHSATGVGFGPDYLLDADARLPLGGSPLLRAPHDFLVNTWARLGTVGLVLLVLLFAVAAREAVRARSVAAREDLVLFATVFPAAFLTNALFGVELEAPFGAVPFFWCLGILLSGPLITSTARGDTDGDGDGDPRLPQPQGDDAAVPRRAVPAGPAGHRAARGPR